MSTTLKQKITIPYTFSDDFKLLKSQMQLALSSTKQHIPILQPTLPSKTHTQMGDRLQALLLNIADKYTKLVETRPDKEVTEKRKIDKPIDQVLVKHNEANLVILKEAMEKYKAKEVGLPGVLVAMPEVRELKVRGEGNGGRDVEMRQFKQEYTEQIGRVEAVRAQEVRKLEVFGADKGMEMAAEAQLLGKELTQLPAQPWDFIDN